MLLVLFAPDNPAVALVFQPTMILWNAKRKIDSKDEVRQYY
jgi:hypothetical protein